MFLPAISSTSGGFLYSLGGQLHGFGGFTGGGGSGGGNGGGGGGGGNGGGGGGNGGGNGGGGLQRHRFMPISGPTFTGSLSGMTTEILSATCCSSCVSSSLLLSLSSGITSGELRYNRGGRLLGFAGFTIGGSGVYRLSFMLGSLYFRALRNLHGHRSRCPNCRVHATPDHDPNRPGPLAANPLKLVLQKHGIINHNR